jgi:hypothetical protein
MGFLDFLFKRKKMERIKDSREKFELDKFSLFLERKEKSIEDKQKAIIQEIRLNIFSLIRDLDNLVVNLKEVDISNKNETEKIKHIVKINHEMFLESVIKLKKNLEDFYGNEGLNFSDFFKEVELIFLSFEKESFSSFQKATYLIGKEIGDVIKEIKRFNKFLEQIKKENITIFLDSEIIESIKTNYEEFKEISVLEKRSREEIQDKEDEIKSIKRKVGYLKEEISKFEESSEYKEKEEKKNELEVTRKELESMIVSFRRGIDFKELARTYHSFEKKIAIIKEYKENFKDIFERDKGEQIIEMLSEDKKQTAREKIEKILDIEKRVKILEELVLEDKKIISLNLEIQALKNKIIELEKEKGHFDKKSVRFRQKKEDLLEKLRDDFEKIV